MIIRSTILAAAVASLGTLGSLGTAQADGFEPMQAASIDLGNVSGVTYYTVERDNFRVCNGQFNVYRTRDLGKSWQRLTDGLPGPGNYQSVYREGLATDGLDPEGVYAGTSNGMVYASADGGDHWQALPGMLPPILSVSCGVW